MGEDEGEDGGRMKNLTSFQYFQPFFLLFFETKTGYKVLIRANLGDDGGMTDIRGMQPKRVCTRRTI